MADAFLQVAPDSTGKQVDMEQVATASGPTLYRQRAVLVGLTAEQFDEILTINRAQLACLRAILQSINSPNSQTTEDEFTGV